MDVFKGQMTMDVFKGTNDNGRVQGTNDTSSTEYAQSQQHITYESPCKYDEFVSTTRPHSERLRQVIHEENVYGMVCLNKSARLWKVVRYLRKLT